jgi:hypothetical protein
MEVFAEPIKLAQVPLERKALVRRENLLAKPCAALRRAQVLMRTSGDQVRVQDRLHDVLQPGALPHKLIATGDLPAHSRDGDQPVQAIVITDSRAL